MPYNQNYTAMNNQFCSWNTLLNLSTYVLQGKIRWNKLIDSLFHFFSLVELSEESNEDELESAVPDDELHCREPSSVVLTDPPSCEELSSSVSMGLHLGDPDPPLSNWGAWDAIL